MMDWGVGVHVNMFKNVCGTDIVQQGIKEPIRSMSDLRNRI